MTYQTPNAACEAIYAIKKSEFLAFAYPIDSREQAMGYVANLRTRFPDARHHCYGYIIGDPNNTTSAGFDDDGEPNGTAGRPILNVLQHKSIGNCIIIVVRYFGGIKLGAGGLTRAYATSAQMAVDAMTLSDYIAREVVQVQTTFAHEAQIRYLINAAGGDITAADYASDVLMTAVMDSAKVADFVASLGIYGEVAEN